MRRAAKVDSNQKSIVDALRKIGCAVQSLAAVGDGVPDILVSSPPRMASYTMIDPFHPERRLVLMEIKNSAKPPSARRLTEAQRMWHSEWAGTPVYVVETVEQAIAALGAI